MERRLLKPAALIAVGVLASACTPIKIGAGGGPTDTPNDSPRAATSPDHIDRTHDHEPTAADEHTDKKAMQSEVDVQGPAEDVDSAPPGAGAEPERPTAANTGPTGPLTPYSGPTTITANGATYEDFTASWLVIDADNVTLRNFSITSPSWYGIEIRSGHSGIVIEDGEITGSMSAGILGVGFTGRRLYIHDTESDALKTQGVGGPTIVEYSFIEKLGTVSVKPDGNQIAGTTNGVTFRYNNIWMPVPGSPNHPGAPYDSNACVIHESTLTNILYESNWLNGGQFTVYCSVGGVSVRNNRFGRDFNHGVQKGPCDQWTGNVWDDTGEPVTGSERK